VTGDLSWIWFWRESTNDALYSFENVQLRPANRMNTDQQRRLMGTGAA